MLLCICRSLQLMSSVSLLQSQSKLVVARSLQTCRCTSLFLHMNRCCLERLHRSCMRLRSGAQYRGHPASQRSIHANLRIPSCYICNLQTPLNLENVGSKSWFFLQMRQSLPLLQRLLRYVAQPVSVRRGQPAVTGEESSCHVQHGDGQRQLYWWDFLSVHQCHCSLRHCCYRHLHWHLTQLLHMWTLADQPRRSSLCWRHSWWYADVDYEWCTSLQMLVSMDGWAL